MITLVIGMILVTPALACPPGQKCTGNCPNCVNNIANLKNITKIDSATINQDWQTVLKSSDFKKLVKQLESEGYQLNKSGVAGISATLNGTNYEAVGIPLVSKDNSTGVIAAVLENSKIIKVEAQIVKRDSTGFPLSIKSETVTGKSIVSENADVSDLLNGQTKESLAANASLGSITPLITLDKCTACRQIVGVICDVGCGVELSLICILAGVTTIIGGLACGAVVTTMCFFVDWYGCAPGATQLCKNAGYCS
ncbi:MAG: halocin C8-like domain-containing protein [Methanosarcina barkeri]|nr:halocin C8-like domain-containing protein [Methanosarcina sp. ERenArc_MAG2]